MSQAPPETRRELFISAALFVTTTASVWLTYALFWGDGRPIRDPGLALDAARFAVSLMSILLAHELGHYVVARRHGFALSLPWFIPVPLGFGTFGAVIRLRSEPPNRGALLEMGAAGPLAGLVVALVVLALGLPNTGPPPVLPAPPPLPEGGEGLLASIPILSTLLAWINPPAPPGEIPVLVLANPLVMDLLGTWLLGAPPGRFDTLSPTALAGWVGCLLTGINLLPIGQLDGGHILRALRPGLAPRLSRALLIVALLGGLWWSGWFVWAGLLWFMRADQPIHVPSAPRLSLRPMLVAAFAVLAFILTFMPLPFQEDSLPPGAPLVPSEGAG